MALRFKASVDISGISPQMAIALTAVLDLHTEAGYDCWVTSGRDSLHATGSLHYAGHALDFRTKHLPLSARQNIAAQLKLYLSPQYDVVLEHDHLHVEYDPT